MTLTFGKPVQAQDVSRNMIMTDGVKVFRVAKVRPMNLRGLVVTDGDTVRIVSTYTHVQIITSRGAILNLRITDKLSPMVPVSF